ncbi:hypothetical protein CHUAL_007600 [Chamberlinius hualienensis]
MADDELKIISSSLQAKSNSKILTQNDYEDHSIATGNCEFTKRMSILNTMENKRYATGSEDKPVSGNLSTNKLDSAPTNDPRDKKRRKVVLLIAIVTIVLLIMSVLLMAITIQITPSIDERIRKEHEVLVKKMSEGVIKHQNNSRVDGWQKEWNNKVSTSHEKELRHIKINSSVANTSTESR